MKGIFQIIETPEFQILIECKMKLEQGEPPFKVIASAYTNASSKTCIQKSFNTKAEQKDFFENHAKQMADDLLDAIAERKE